jgi:tRNA dimethylallyltransferase
MKKLVAIIGPTGIGKSSLALELAKKLDGEIISADSRQVYRLMDIGTAKSTTLERQGIPHHAIDVVFPDESFSLADFVDIANNEIDLVHGRGRVPILEGGTGQYVWAIIEGWEIPRIKPDNSFRKELEDRALKDGGEVLYEELAKINPQAADRIDPRNVRRVIRALEITETGRESGEQKKQVRYNSFIVGLTAPRKLLYKMIDDRVDVMINEGLVNEVESLSRLGYGPGLSAMSGIGYRQIFCYLEDKISLEEAIQSIKNDSHRLVRMQYNWFSLQDERIKWFDITNPGYAQDIITEVKGFLNE